jgi:DNA-binding GntR family transcriptional regulator
MTTLNAGMPDLRTRSRESSVRGQVYRLLLNDIERCVSKPGQQLSEKEVSATLGVSRTPVREAFLQLAEEGLVVIAPQRGTTVAKISAYQVRQAQFTREVLERSIFAVACRNSADGQVLRENLDVQRSAVERQDIAGFYEADREFHGELARLSGYDGAGRLAGGARVHLNRVRWLGLPDRRNLEIALAEHIEIAAALAAGDAARGDTVLTQHMRGVLGTLPVIRGQYAGYFETDDDNDPPDTSGLAIGWRQQ